MYEVKDSNMNGIIPANTPVELLGFLNQANTELVAINDALDSLEHIKKKNAEPDKALPAIISTIINGAIVVGWFFLPEGGIWNFLRFIILGCFILEPIFIGIAIYYGLKHRKWKKSADKMLSEENGAMAIVKERCAAAKSLPYIPDCYRTTTALQYMIICIQNGRSTTWERCANLFEEQIHRWKLEDYAAEAMAYSKEAAIAARNAESLAAIAAFNSNLNRH